MEDDLRTGVIFDIREFTVHDGPGLRITVFFKGCPLRCQWCHNPEGLTPCPQRNVMTGRMVGKEWTVSDLVGRLSRFKQAFDMSGGGVTFSGGEATLQPEFLIAVANGLRLKGVPVNLDTSGYCPAEIFMRIIDSIDMCYFDIKCMNAKLHERMTGKRNELILDNLRMLSSRSAIPYRIRVPLIPGVSDTQENRTATLAFIDSLSRSPEGIDWLPYNKVAPAKYKNFGMVFPFNVNEVSHVE